MRQIGMEYQYSYEEQWQPKDRRVTFRLYQLNLDGQAERVCKKYWDASTVHFIETELCDPVSGLSAGLGAEEYLDT